ncbi:MAG: ATP-binding protein [Polyangiales bacterium]
MSRPGWLLASMLACVSLVAIAMLLDVRREFADTVQTLKEEQVALATAVGDDFEARLARHEELRALGANTEAVEAVIPELLGGAMELEERGLRLLLVARPRAPGLLNTHGKVVHSAALARAVAENVNAVELPREEAAQLGLPPRLAIAGVHRVRGWEGPWGVVVVVSGDRLRAREQYAQLRFLLGLGLVAALVSGFGGLALKQQRRRLEVARALEIEAVERDRERLLGKADKLATLAALSSGIAHELATPLGTIMARIEQVLPAVAEQPKASAALNVALEQVERIQRIIRGVLGLARGELPALSRARPDALAHAAVAFVQHRFGKAGVRIEVMVPASLPDIACDPPMLEQALTNLLLNACDASRRGATVHLRAHADHGRLFFDVDDEGEGISEETAARAQEPFFTTKPTGRGTGLGLAIAREIVAHHQGRLSLAQRSDARGTRATIELPHV